MSKQLPDTQEDWDIWITDFHNKMIDLGYRKFNQNHYNENYSYWKTVKQNGVKIYQVGILVYDFRKYAHIDMTANKISISYQCSLLRENRIDMKISDNTMSIEKFEELSNEFYKTISNSLK